VSAIELLLEDAVGQGEALRDGDVSARELVSAYLARIDRLDGSLRSYVTLDAERALAAAAAADDDHARGIKPASPVHGVTVSIKDVEDVAGIPTTHSCEALVDNMPGGDGPVAARIRAAGLVILGKTNLPEFCTDVTTSKINGVCRNPWDLQRTAGGSSGGAAAALAAALCAVAHGTDGAGSVRVPAAWCGLVGLKPSRGLVSFGPEEGPAYYGTTGPGVLSRSVRDAAAFLDVLAPEGPWTPHRERSFADEVTRPPERLRIGISTTPPMGTVDEECAAAAVSVGEVLEALGHHVDTVEPAWDVILQAAMLPMQVPGPAALVSTSDFDRVEPRNRPLVERLASLTLLDHHRLIESARSAGRRFRELWESVDLLLTPTAGMMPPDADWANWDDDPSTHLGRFASFANFAQPFNLSGQPAVSLPMGWASNGLPIGVQLAGRPLEEATLLQVAAQLERAVPWSDRIAAAARRLDAD
jgi:amidase